MWRLGRILLVAAKQACFLVCHINEPTIRIDLDHMRINKGGLNQDERHRVGGVGNAPLRVDMDVVHGNVVPKSQMM
jgi:hypothetical protein